MAQINETTNDKASVALKKANGSARGTIKSKFNNDGASKPGTSVEMKAEASFPPSPVLTTSVVRDKRASSMTKLSEFSSSPDLWRSISKVDVCTSSMDDLTGLQRSYHSLRLSKEKVKIILIFFFSLSDAPFFFLFFSSSFILWLNFLI